MLSRDFGAGVGQLSLLELGCFDAKTLDFLEVRPGRYVGFDAGWHSGLDYAKQRFADDPTVEFRVCTSPEQLTGDYDIALCMETLEHLPLRQLDAFAAQLALSAPRLYATVPVEWGPVFFLKHLYKLLNGITPEDYRLGEFLAASIGWTSHVERDEGAHKGFDYRNLVKTLQRHYGDIRTYNLHLPGMPLWLSGGVGIVASRS